MASRGREGKRKLNVDGGVSPPPLKRKVQQSLTTQNAVASFFTPLSQKTPERTLWQERGPDVDSPHTLLVGRYEPENPETCKATGGTAIQRSKIAAFDFDSTLIQTNSGKKHASEAHDWKWWHPSIPGILKKLYMEDGFLIVIISNQAGLALKSDTKAPKVARMRLAAFKTKVNTVFSQLDLPISIYAATEKDIYRKPRTGMWMELLENFDLNTLHAINLNDSFFVGDAGGRLPASGLGKDFSSSDRYCKVYISKGVTDRPSDFAENLGIKFHAPEEFFLNEAPRPFRRTFEPSRYTRDLGDPSDIVPQLFQKRNKQDIVLLCGSPAAGKSSFFWRHLEPLQYERINQDILKTRERCLKAAGGLLSEGKSVAVDNTNADREVRNKWVELATKHKVPIRCVLFLAAPELCEHNNTVRALNQAMNPEKRNLLPKMAFSGFLSRYQRPQVSEGFQDIVEAEFKFQGTKAERDIWTQYWM